MSIASEISRLQIAKADLKTTINNLNGISVIANETIDEYSNLISSTTPLPATLPIGATTVRISASSTENIASNNHIRILGSDNNKYTLAEWNALFIEAGYDKNNMTVTPIGINIEAFDNTRETYIFERYEGITYTPVGDTAGAAGKLQHSIYNQAPINAIGSGTDSTTSKDWSITSDGDNWVLYSGNTKQSWNCPKNTQVTYAHASHNISDRTESLYVQTEWMRHRMAISSGISTSKTDGTMGEIQILNGSGNQAAVGEDMYFWIKNDSNILVNTGILAKYNINNLHGSTYGLTTTIRDAIYARQIANGINMNDTGVNSVSKPILAPGSKGAEVIAVSGEWMIITPFISNANITTSTASNNMADAPAVYYAKYKGYSLPSDSLINCMYYNKTLVNAVINYLNNREGWGIPVVPTNDYIWTAVRSSATNAWLVYFNNGYVLYISTFNRYFVCLAQAS